MSKTFLFDFDGTLVDSMPTYIRSTLKILDEYKIKYSEDIIKIITPLGTLGTANYFIKLGVPLTLNQIFDKMKEGMIKAYLYDIPPKDSVVETVKELKKRGCGLNVLTASPHLTLDPCLKRIGIFDCFDNVWSCDDFSTTKTDVNIYKMAAEKIGKPIEEIIFIDDNYNADLTAKKAGMKVYGVYDKSSDEYVDDIKNIVDKYIYNFKELL